MSLTEEPQAEDDDEAGAGIVPNNGEGAIDNTPAASSGAEGSLRAPGRSFLQPGGGGRKNRGGGVGLGH